jgi:hypothetical protein
MASPPFKIHENTAAALLRYQQYNRGGGTELAWTRFSSVNQEFEVAEAAGLRYLIKFASNFSKKHLATFSKKEARTQLAAYYRSQQPGQGGNDEENWRYAQKQLLDEKILKILDVRNPFCTCGHRQKPDIAALTTTGHSNSGNCKHTACTCPGFAPAQNNFVARRTLLAKPDVNPLLGAPANQSSCIVLNWIPKGEFILVVGNSIRTAETAYAAAHGGAVIPNDAPTVPLTDLRWDFPTRPGAVRHAQDGVIDLDNGTWCKVGAKKMAGGPAGIAATWTIVHWAGQG